MIEILDYHKVASLLYISPPGHNEIGINKM